MTSGCRTTTTLALLLALAPTLAGAAAPPELEALMARLAARAGGTATYTETKHLAVLEEPLVITGRVWYEAPDTLIKTVAGDPEERFQVSGNRLDVFRGTRRVRTVSLSRQPLAAAFMASYRATLSGDVETLREHYELAYEPAPADEPDRWTLTLDPVDPALAERVERVVIHGEDDVIDCFELYETDGDWSRMLIHVDAGPDSAGAD